MLSGRIENEIIHGKELYGKTGDPIKKNKHDNGKICISDTFVSLSASLDEPGN